jgi:hypothetical protein
MPSAVWLLVFLACTAADVISSRRRLARIRRMLLAYESATRVFDPRPFDRTVMSRDLRLLMRRHGLADALFPSESFERLEADLRLSDGAAEAEAGVRAKMRLLLYRIYGCEERHARHMIDLDELARRFCEGPVYALRLLRAGVAPPGERLLVGAFWVAVLYDFLVRYAV